MPETPGRCINKAVTSRFRDDLFKDGLSIQPDGKLASLKETDVANLQNAIDTLLRLLTQFGLVVAAALTELEMWIRSQLQQFGLPHAVQTLLLLAVAAGLLLGALRLFGGVIRIALVVVLLLVAIDIVMPVIKG
jgi:hypothetical protein